MKASTIELISEVRKGIQYIGLPIAAGYILVPEVREFVNNTVTQAKNGAKKIRHKVAKR